MKVSLAHRTGENERKKYNDKRKKVGPNACGVTDDFLKSRKMGYFKNADTIYPDLNFKCLVFVEGRYTEQK